MEQNEGSHRAAGGMSDGLDDLDRLAQRLLNQLRADGVVLVVLGPGHHFNATVQMADPPPIGRITEMRQLVQATAEAIKDDGSWWRAEVAPSH